jgi:hypothetical protein
MRQMGTLESFEKTNFYHKPTMCIIQNFPSWATEFPCIMDIATRDTFFGEKECLRYLGIMEEKALHTLARIRGIF